jgi:[acyl-carrier-protein] S-malonyltransferase
MVAVLGLDIAPLEEICQRSGAEIANINCPGQVVLSGSTQALSQAMELAKANGARRVVPLEVSGAFHSRLMQPAQEGMSQAIAALSFGSPLTPVIANTTAQPLTTAEEIKAELVRQLCHCVRWQQSVEYMINAGVSTFVEIGPGQVLSGLIKRIHKGAETVHIGDTLSPQGEKA